MKVKSKTRPINALLEKVDFLLIGGKVADIILKGGKESSLDAETEQQIKEIQFGGPKLKLPLDFIVSSKKKGPWESRVCSLDKARPGEVVFDIGPKTRKVFSEIIQKAKMIFWAGPLGMIEEEIFSHGSLEIAEAIIGSEAFSVVSGGETTSFLKEAGLAEKFSYISLGGGAMLEFLSTGTLPGIEALLS